MRFTRPRDQHETPRTSADRTRPDRVRTDLTCDTGGCHGTGACLHTGTCHHTGGCHQTSADDPSLPIAHRDVPRRSVLSRRSVLGAGVGAGALALTGCAGVPTEGPVERVNSPGPAAGQDPIDVNPRPPEPGASRELIVAGFLQAMSSSIDAYRSARAYLTDEAAQHWDPYAGALIYDSEFHKPTVDDDRAVLHAPLIATLDASGHHDLCGHGLLDHDFALVEVAGLGSAHRAVAVVVRLRAWLPHDSHLFLGEGFRSRRSRRHPPSPGGGQPDQCCEGPAGWAAEGRSCR